MIGDFLLLFLILGAASVALFLKSVQKDRADAEKQEAHARQERAAAWEEARKYQAGTPLVCLGCGACFQGPLTESGCPECHLSTLVMTETQSQEKHL